jgi:protein-L-isoaspartate(D-aspartate) O-methyltransferase
MQNKNINELQTRLVEELINKKVLKSKEIEKAFLTVPRHLFLPGVDLEKVYSDAPVVTKWDGEFPLSSSSQPSVYAIMLEQLELKEGMKILEIGAGTGFNAALLAQITGDSRKVITIDIDKDITGAAQKNLISAGIQNVKVVCGRGELGYEAEAPYDRIVITAGVWDIYPEWFKQLKPGGILLLPMIIKIHDQASFAFKHVNGHLESISISSCKFMELRGDYTKPVNPVTIGKSGIITLVSSATPLKNKEKYFSSFINPRKDTPTGISASYSEYDRSFLPWLEITEPKFCVLSSSVESPGLTYLPAPYKFKGKTVPMFFGISEKENVALIDCIEENPGKGGHGQETFAFHISTYSDNDSLAKHLQKRIIEWDKAGRPQIIDFKVKAYFDKSDILPDKDEFLITKKWAKLLFRWQ